MISRVQLHNFYLMEWIKIFLKINWLEDKFQSTDEKSIVYWKVKLWLFFIKIKFQRLQFIKTCQNVKLVHQEIKKPKFHFEKSKFLKLEFFLSVGNFMFFHNFKQNFHHDARWFKGNFQHESYISPWNLQLFFNNSFKKFLDLKLYF